jgi:hypothetical protein
VAQRTEVALADWGYNTAEHRAAAIAAGIPVWSQADLLQRASAAVVAES